MKVELTLQFLDEWMLRWHKFQTESDWRIEKDRQWWRKTNIFITGVLAGGLTLYTSGNATLKRQFGPPHLLDIGVDAKIKQYIYDTLMLRPRYTPTGYGRLLVMGVPIYLTFVSLEHVQERRRLRRYLDQKTVFGEQARRLVNTSKIEEFLPVNIKASLPQSEAKIYS
ncbi:unnamed protein product [Phytomonas sp. Hart1]|nr:unnamed protein product [Phytomonas sp. Hart1]|eukprot:CCW71114.1 unnamed protein product [Phytomonas sp. isolate Hart1]